MTPNGVSWRRREAKRLGAPLAPGAAVRNAVGACCSCRNRPVDVEELTHSRTGPSPTSRPPVAPAIAPRRSAATSQRPRAASHARPQPTKTRPSYLARTTQPNDCGLRHPDRLPRTFRSGARYRRPEPLTSAADVPVGRAWAVRTRCPIGASDSTHSTAVEGILEAPFSAPLTASTRCPNRAPDTARSASLESVLQVPFPPSVSVAARCPETSRR